MRRESPTTAPQCNAKPCTKQRNGKGHRNGNGKGNGNGKANVNGKVEKANRGKIPQKKRKKREEKSSNRTQSQPEGSKYKPIKFAGSSRTRAKGG